MEQELFIFEQFFFRVWCKIACVENMYQKDQHSARKIEYDKGVGHILYRAMMHGQRL